MYLRSKNPPYIRHLPHFWPQLLRLNFDIYEKSSNSKAQTHLPQVIATSFS
jgi:hypothetical protein